MSKRAAKKPPKLSATPTVAELTAAYKYLLTTGSYVSSCEGQAFFYDACWSDDAELERVFEAWCDAQDNPRNLPLDLLEEEYVHAGKFAELHEVIAGFDAAQLARAVPMMRAFLAAPKRAQPYSEIQE